MVVVTLPVEYGNLNLYMDGGLHNYLTNNVQASVKKKDFDQVLLIDGPEGSGKSVFGFQCARVLDPHFTIDNICFTPQDFIKAVVKAKKFSCIVFDEAFTGLSSRSSLTEMNQLLVSLMMEMRQKNLFIILIMPTFYMLDKYAVLHRAKGLFHIRLYKGKRGYWEFYNRAKMKELYLKGRKMYDYSIVKRHRFGRFREQYTIDEDSYREKKKEALNSKNRKTKAESFKSQRDLLVWIMYKELNISQSQISRLARKHGWKVSQASLSQDITKREQELLNTTT